MKLLQTKKFSNVVKKLHKNQKQDLDIAVQKIIVDPKIGQQKTGDLSAVMVYKFYMVKQLMLLAYSINNDTVTLLALGTHENFYRDLNA